MYFAADGGKNRTHRIYVIENASSDPQEGEWVFKGQLGDATNKWAIDASAFELHNQLYLIWSGWESDENGQQNIYIAKMSDPYTIESKRVLLSAPTYPWETFGNLNDPDNPRHVSVNEGPEILLHGNKIFLIYSASAAGQIIMRWACCRQMSIVICLIRSPGKNIPDLCLLLTATAAFIRRVTTASLSRRTETGLDHFTTLTLHRVVAVMASDRQGSKSLPGEKTGRLILVSRLKPELFWQHPLNKLSLRSNPIFYNCSRLDTVRTG